MPVQERDAYRCGVLEDAEVDRIGDGFAGRRRLGDRASVRVLFQDVDEAVIGAGRVGLHPYGSGTDAKNS